MRVLALLLALPLLAAPAFAQDAAAGKTGGVYESDRYRVRITGPMGWSKTLEGPKSSGTWVNLVEFTESRSKATALLSASATQFRSPDEMIEYLTRQFEKDAALAILRKEVRAATANRPKGILFEYTTQSRRGPLHMVVAYYLHMGYRYRVLGTAREAAWRSVSGDLERFASSLEFTGRLFREDSQNFTDEAQNFAIYFPETWTVKLPAEGPRVAFTGKKMGVAVWIYVHRSSGDLGDDMDRVVRDLERAKGKVTKRGRETTHPALGLKFLELEYTRPGSDGTKFFYHETAMVHRDRLYRFVLVGTGNAVKAAKDVYEKMVETINFLR